MKHFYAIQWTYGRAWTHHGTRIGTYFRFDHNKERNDFCDNGPNCQTNPGYREAVLSKDPELRRILGYGTLRVEADGEMLF